MPSESRSARSIASSRHGLICWRLEPTFLEPTFLTRTILALLESAHPSLNTRDLHRVAAALRCVAAAQFWARMRTGFDMNVPEIAEVFERTVLQVLNNLPL